MCTMTLRLFFCIFKIHQSTEDSFAVKNKLHRVREYYTVIHENEINMSPVPQKKRIAFQLDVRPVVKIDLNNQNNAMIIRCFMQKEYRMYTVCVMSIGLIAALLVSIFGGFEMAKNIWILSPIALLFYIPFRLLFYIKSKMLIKMITEE